MSDVKWSELETKSEFHGIKVTHRWRFSVRFDLWGVSFNNPCFVPVDWEVSAKIVTPYTLFSLLYKGQSDVRYPNHKRIAAEDKKMMVELVLSCLRLVNLRVAHICEKGGGTVEFNNISEHDLANGISGLFLAAFDCGFYAHKTESFCRLIPLEAWLPSDPDWLGGKTEEEKKRRWRNAGYEGGFFCDVVNRFSGMKRMFGE